MNQVYQGQQLAGVSSQSLAHYAVTGNVALPETHEAAVKALIEASKEETNYGVRQLARQQLLKIDRKAAEAAGIK